MAVYTEAIRSFAITEEDVLTEYYNFNLMVENFDITVVTEGFSFKTIVEKLKEMWKKLKEFIKKTIKFFKDKIKEFKIKFENWFANNAIKFNKNASKKSEEIRDKDKEEANKREENKESNKIKKISISYYDHSYQDIESSSYISIGIHDLINSYSDEKKSKIGIVRSDFDSMIFDTSFNTESEILEKFNNKEEDALNEIKNIFDKSIENIKNSYDKLNNKFKNIKLEMIEEIINYNYSTEETEAESKENIIKYVEKIKTSSRDITESLFRISESIGGIDKESNYFDKFITKFYKLNINVEPEKLLKCPCQAKMLQCDGVFLKEIMNYCGKVLSLYQQLAKRYYNYNQHNKIEYMKLGNIIEPGRFKPEQEKEPKKDTSSTTQNKNTVYGYLA